MRVETVEQVARVVPTISALLAAFASSMISNVIGHVERPRLGTAIIICFIVAASAMLVVTFNASCMLISLYSSGYPQQREYVHLNSVEGIVHVTKWAFYGGLVFLLGGVAMRGWLHSRLVGLCACPIIFVAGCIIMRTIIVLGV